MKSFLKKHWLTIFFAVAFLGFFGWRMLRPMNIFVIDDAFALPVPVGTLPKEITTLNAASCLGCHLDHYLEWQTTIHAHAWTDPYFQTDFAFDGSQQICKNCHIPLAPQQEDTVLGWKDAERWQPRLTPNPDFDAALQKEGINCAGCHLRKGKILATHTSKTSPHNTKIIRSGNQICVRCHVVGGNRWDTFYKVPPCGTVAEIREGRAQPPTSAELTVTDVASLGCVGCHMPVIKRPLAPGGISKTSHQHIWRGGHDPAQVRKALSASMEQVADSESGQIGFALYLTNTGTAHNLPTGTPDRHLSVELKILDASGDVLAEKTTLLQRHFLWRPFIIELADTRLRPKIPQKFQLDADKEGHDGPFYAEAVVRYHLLTQARRKKIGYHPKTPISYEIFRRRIVLEPR